MTIRNSMTDIPSHEERFFYVAWAEDGITGAQPWWAHEKEGDLQEETVHQLNRWFH